MHRFGVSELLRRADGVEAEASERERAKKKQAMMKKVQ